MAKYILSAAVSGSAFAEVEAESPEAAIEAASSADWKIDSWDLNVSPNSNGYIEAEEAE